MYEDRDGSADLPAGDLVRLDRGGAPALRSRRCRGLVTTEHCCVDLDGGGPDDDALLVIGVPPDRVVMAAIYERPRGPRAGRPVALPASLRLAARRTIPSQGAVDAPDASAA